MLFQQLLSQQLLREIQLDFPGARSAARIGHAGAGMERGSAWRCTAEEGRSSQEYRGRALGFPLLETTEIKSQIISDCIYCALMTV